MGCRCGQNKDSYRLISLPGGSKVGIYGLDEIFEKFCLAGRNPNDETAAEIVEELEEKNYIAPPARKKYQIAVLMEYRIFCKSKGGK